MSGAQVAPSAPPAALDSTDAGATVEIEEVIKGMQFAALAITDDEEGTLEKTGKFNPWHVEALRMISGSEEEAHKPLTHLLKEHMNLQCDSIIDISGVTKGGHFLDTQGYIAHNDQVIVLAYRCTTSIFDWLTNLNTTSSEWEIEEDVAQGFSGYCSGLEGLCCNGGEGKPRVHTGFYNNFLSTVPLIKEHIDPLLQPDQPPRKLYVAGHSLGAGIATLASCYFLLEYDWNNLPHSMVGVTAGSPRTCLQQMKEVVESELEKKSSKVGLMRIVRNKDVVATVPPAVLGFQHLGRLVYITEEGEIHLDSQEPERDTDEERVKLAASKQAAPEDEEELSKYDKKVNKIPKAFRDHMPDFYLSPMRVYRTSMFPPEEEEEEADDQSKNSRKSKGKEKKKSNKKGFRLSKKNKAEEPTKDAAADAGDAGETKTKKKFFPKLFGRKNKNKAEEVPELPQEQAQPAQ